MTGIELIAKERQRQIEEEGWTLEHDAEYNNNELAVAAASYAMPQAARTYMILPDGKYLPIFWPFDTEWWKPCADDRIKELTKAGALIAAEIDRILGEQLKSGK